MRWILLLISVFWSLGLLAYLLLNPAYQGAGPAEAPALTILSASRPAS